MYDLYDPFLTHMYGRIAVKIIIFYARVCARDSVYVLRDL